MRSRTVFGVVCLFVLAFGGHVKGTILFAWLPVDLTLLAAAGAVLAGVLCVIDPGRRYPLSGVAVVGLLITAMSLGLLHEQLNSYAVEKRIDVLVVVPACLLGGLLLLDARLSRRAWLAGVVALGPLMIALSVITPAAYSYGVMWPEGSSTISVGRTAGAALIVLCCLVLSKRLVLPAVALAPVLVAGMVLCESRGPMLAALVALGVVTLSASKHARGMALLGAAGVVVTAGAALAAKPERFTSLTDASASIRFQLWEETFGLALGHPFTGIGWGNLYDFEDPALRLGLDALQYPHNVPLEVASEAGLVALAALVLAMVLAVRSQWRAARSGVTELAMLGLLVFAVVNSMVSGDVGSNRELWVAIGCAWGWRAHGSAGDATSTRGAAREEATDVQPAGVGTAQT